jgi:hypothetical protein
MRSDVSCGREGGREGGRKGGAGMLLAESCDDRKKKNHNNEINE